MSGTPVTAFVETTDSLVDETVSTIATAKPAWTCAAYSGTSDLSLFARLSDLKLPAAVVAYRGSDWANRPRRTLTLVVLVVCADAQQEAGAETARGMVDSVVAALDQHQKTGTQTLWRVKGDEAVDLDNPDVSCHAITFDVEDH